uniref:Putative serine/threonine-protein kinase n=1 Tax=Anopheles darlingi TaxID=43151 RepID=A0A2M4CG22_ANODA
MGNWFGGGTGGRVTSGCVDDSVGLGQSIPQPAAPVVGPVHPQQQQQQPQPRATTTRIDRDASEAADDEDNVVGIPLHGVSSAPLDELTSGGQDSQDKLARRGDGVDSGISLARSPELVVVASRRAVSFQLPNDQRDEPVGPVRLYRQAIRRLADSDWLRGRLPSVAHLLRETANPSRRRARRHPSRTRPISRISRRRWHQSTVGSDGGQLLKTCWPVRQTEGLFLPLFPVDERRQHRYDREAHLGDGAFGQVYRVRDTTEHTDTQYALKLLRKSNILDGDGVRQLQDEVSIQRLCGHHPFIVGCLDFWQNRTHIFLLSSYYGNGELFQRLKLFTAELTRLYVAELAIALDFLHNAGIIYRDLKSENLLLDDRFHLKLIDFGLSRWLSVGSYTRTFCGTVQYMGKLYIHYYYYYYYYY